MAYMYVTDHRGIEATREHTAVQCSHTLLSLHQIDLFKKQIETCKQRKFLCQIEHLDCIPS